MLRTILYRVHYSPTLAKKTLYLVGLALAGPDVSGLPITMSCKKYRVALHIHGYCTLYTQYGDISRMSPSTNVVTSGMSLFSAHRKTCCILLLSSWNTTNLGSIIREVKQDSISLVVWIIKDHVYMNATSNIIFLNIIMYMSTIIDL